MTVFPILIDTRPPYVGEPGPSLLQLPLGTGTVLSFLRRALSGAAFDERSVLACLPISEEYERAIAEEAALRAVFPAAQFANLLAEFEPSDWLLLIDPVHFSVAGQQFQDVLTNARRARMVTYLVAPATKSNLAEERVLLDDQGHVRRIQRYYAGCTQIEPCEVLCSLVPAAVAQVAGSEPFTSLGDLRRKLADYGIPSRDLQHAGGATDLRQESGLLALNESVLHGLNGTAGRASARVADGIYRGSRCQIHPTARLYGPVVVQDDVCLEKESIVIGPAVLGRRCRVRRGAVLAHCVILPETVIPARAALRQCVVPHKQIAGQHAVAADAGTCIPAMANGFEGAEPAHHESTGRQRSTERYLTVKRIADTVLATLGLLALSPVILVSAVLIKLTSPGPVLFAHPREGKGGREFRCWKFRTMVAGAHALQRSLYKQNLVDGPQFKLNHDPRITWLGRWLRTTNIDELPQLINVVRGEMSLIGPRPSPFRENQICVPWRQARLSVRPGITGLWQICRHERSAGDFHQWIYFDTLYVRHLSFWLDLKIVLATLLTLAGRWSVPLRWMIPLHKMQINGFVGLPVRAPILETPPPPAMANALPSLT